MLDAKTLQDALVNVVRSAGLHLEEVRISHQDTMPLVRVIVDLPDGTQSPDANTLAAVSRDVSSVLDDLDPISGGYLLEVTTPGIARELTEVRHWRRNLGRPVRVRMRDGSRIEGAIAHVDQESVVLDVGGEATTIAFENVKRARPRVEFDSEE